MEIVRLFWFEHNCKDGQYSSAKVHDSIKVTSKCDMPRSFSDYEIEIIELEGLRPEVIR